MAVAGLDSPAPFWAADSGFGYVGKVEDDVMLGVDQVVLARIAEMGFDKLTAAKALKKENNNEQRAIEALLSGSI